MTIEDFGDIVLATATAGQTLFTFPYKIFSDEDLSVYYVESGDESNPLGNILTLNIDYTVAFSADTGGTITLLSAATEGALVIIARTIPNSRDTDFVDGGNNWTATTINKQLDKITAIISQVHTLLTKRGLLYNIDEDIEVGQTTLPKLPANYYWKADGSGNLVAAECVEEGDCSSLRSELLSQTETAPGTDNVGYYDEEAKTGTTLTNFLNNLRPQKDDIAVVENKADPTKQVKLSAQNVGAGETRTIFMPDNDVDLGAITSSKLPRGYCNGFLLSNNATESKRVVEVSNGECDAYSTFDIINNGGTFYCKVDLGWQVGRGADGSPKGKMANGVTWTGGTWYYMAAISKPDGTVDVGIDIVNNFSNLFSTPAVDAAGFTNTQLYRRIGMLFAHPTTGDVRKFNITDDDWVYWDEPISTTADEYKQELKAEAFYSYNTKVPPLNCMVDLNCMARAFSETAFGQKIYFYNTNMTEIKIDDTNDYPPIASLIVSAGTIGANIKIPSVGGQIKYAYKGDGQSVMFWMWTRGYRDKRILI